ncbi:hypothetical protein [Demetria terragena]|uniref:class III lanthionine synthetase LanKC N-terminal domain-containing protein n=1 Tax=Demetria terragena TaxID=63959 RepID=UPI0003A1E212|nr:hypothetical protein [Demetria terragena]
MDDRYFYFALADPDFFDLPGTGDHPELPVPAHLVAAFTRAAHGPWVAFLPPHQVLADAGWKIHVSAVPEHARHAVEVVARVCAAEHVPWKMMRTERLVQASQHKYAPQSLSGKVCVLYPRSDDQTALLIERLAADLTGVVGPRITGDHSHPTAPLGVRWGAYKEHWLEAADGRVVPGAQGPDGGVPDDRRRPAPNVPAVVADLMRAEREPQPLPVQAARLVHRCNAGSVYDAQLTDGRRVALKEARRHAGLDGDGIDAVVRLRHEYAVLQRLSGSGVAPEPIDYWEVEASEFLVMEWVDGEPMGQHISRHHPGARADLGADVSADFAEWVAQISVELSEVVRRMRALGVAHGDLHPGNVVLGPCGPTLVDFEAASLDGTVATRTIGTPGYVYEHADPVARDDFALQRTLATLKNVDVPLLDRRPDLAPILGCPTVAAEPVDVPATTADLLERLVEGLLGRATPERSDRLFSGGIEQFTTPLGAHNLLSGAAGVLLALHSMGYEPDPRHLDWLADLPEGPDTQVHGLAEGVEGVALALALLGRPEQAEVLIDRLSPSLPRSLSWTRGRSGCAVALVELGIALDRADLLERGVEAGDGVLRAIRDEATTVAGPGLLEGWAGMALALMRIGEAVPSRTASYENGAGHALRREERLLRTVDGHLVAAPGSRVRTGLGHGSAAFALALALAHHRDRDAMASLGDSVAAGLRTTPTPLAGLMDGAAGIAATLRLRGERGTADLLDARAGRYCTPTARGWSTLGAARLRCSDDLMTGAAGLIATLGDSGAKRIAEVLRLPEASPPTTANDTCHAGSLAVPTLARAQTGV